MAKKQEEATNPQEGKLKALQAALSKIEKDFGKGSIMRMGDEQIVNVEVIPTGSIGLNAALGVGGYSVQSLQVRLRWPSMPLPSARKQVALLLSLMQNTPLTVSTLPTLV